MLKSNLVVTYEVGKRDILVLLIHGVLLSLCSRVDVRCFHYFIFLVCCCVLTNSMSLGSRSVATAAAAFSFCSFMACCWVNSAGWMCVVFVIFFSCLLLGLASFRRWIDFRMHNRWTWRETIFSCYAWFLCDSGSVQNRSLEGENSWIVPISIL
jgi:hypothetical protein